MCLNINILLILNIYICLRNHMSVHNIKSTDVILEESDIMLSIGL